MQQDHVGLQLDDRPEGNLEIAPEAKLRAPLERRSSLNRPEVAHQYSAVPQQDSGAQDVREYYRDEKNGAFATGQPTAPAQAQQPNTSRRKRKLIWTSVAIAILVVVLAAVLGGVLGTVLPKDDESTASSTPSNSAGPASPPSTVTDTGNVKAQDLSGIAAFVPSEHTQDLFMYYQDPYNRLRERVVRNATLIVPHGNEVDDRPVTDGVAQGSPIAAVEYSLI